MNMSCLIPIAQVQFVERQYLQNPDGSWRYTIRMPSFLAEWDVWPYWERERLLSMEQLLRQGDILFDIGAETGWMSVAFAGIVGAQNMVLFESTPENWPNIKATWEENQLAPPLRTFYGLVGKTLGEHALENGWPSAALSGLLTPARSYRYIHEHAHSTPQITIDEFCTMTGIVPKALTIDVEGAEICVVEGAQKLLTKYDPLLWISVHPDLMFKDYNTTVEEFSRTLDSLGYSDELISIDHETHTLWRKAR